MSRQTTFRCDICGVCSEETPAGWTILELHQATRGPLEAALVQQTQQRHAYDPVERFDACGACMAGIRKRAKGEATPGR